MAPPVVRVPVVVAALFPLKMESTIWEVPATN
jgi:hypothetical protein